LCSLLILMPMTKRLGGTPHMLSDLCAIEAYASLVILEAMS